MAALPAALVRQAAALLAKHGYTPGEVSPRTLAGSAQELDTSVDEALALVISLKGGGQGQGPVPNARKVLRHADRKAIDAVS